MASLCSPVLVGPLSEWSSSIRIDGCIPDAVLTVLSLKRSPGAVIAKGKVTGGTTRLQLMDGVKLNQQDRLIAIQGLSGSNSTPPSDALALGVAPAPTSMAGLANAVFVSHLWEFGMALQVQGSVPGANITISSPDGVLGASIANEGLARIKLSGVLPAAGTQIIAGEEAPAGFSPVGTLLTTGTVNGLPVPEQGVLPTPTNPQSPQPGGCDPALLVGGVFDGALVTVTISTNPTPENKYFDLDELWFVLAQPLPASGANLEVIQSMPRSERAASTPLLIAAGPSPAPTRPVFLPPCPGAEWIGVASLLPGADLTVQIDDVIYNAGQVSLDSSTANLRVPPIAAGAVITISQQRCGGTATATATAQTLTAQTNPDLGDTPFQCVFRVRVVSATPGALIEIRARRQDIASSPIRTISAQVIADSTVMHIAVSPALSTQDEIWVAQLTCSPPWSEGPHHPVQPVPPLAPPDLLFPPVIGDTSIPVSAIPGAVIEVFLWENDVPVVFLGSGPVDPDANRVPVYRPFAEGDQIVLLQRLCTTFSNLGPPSDMAVPGTKIFALPIGQSLTYPSDDGYEITCSASGVSAVTMTCRVDGTWSCTANLTNTQPTEVCTFTLSFVAADAAGVIFSQTLDGQVIPANTFYSDDGTPIPPTRHITWPWKPLTPPLEVVFSDPTIWQRLLNAQGTFSFEIAVWGGGPVSPDIVEDETPPS